MAITGFQRLSASYRRFALNERGGEKFIDLLAEAVRACGVSDAVLEKAIDKAYNGNMVDIEYAKELFHSRLRHMPAGCLPPGVDAGTLFDDAGKQIQRFRPGEDNDGMS